jgi:hypothetical protein
MAAGEQHIIPRVSSGEAVHRDQVDPVNEFLPEVKPRGHVLVVSDYRSLNVGHAAALCKAGYAVYTAVTCTDVPRVYESFDVEQIDLIAFASLVHGWHHREAEERPPGLPMESDAEWQTRNILQVVDLVSRRQQSPPKVLIATDLVDYECYSVSKCALEQAGLKIQTYSAGNPPSILRLLQA